MKNIKDQIGTDMILKYNAALSKAILYVFHYDVEPTSALREGASSEGIEYGGELLHFINWANSELEGRGVWL